MKKLLALILISMLFFLSSCYYSYSDIEEEREKLNDEWSAEYEELENRYFETSDELEQLIDSINDCSDDFSILLSYFDNEGLYTFEDASEAFDNVFSIYNR